MVLYHVQLDQQLRGIFVSDNARFSSVQSDSLLLGQANVVDDPLTPAINLSPTVVANATHPAGNVNTISPTVTIRQLLRRMFVGDEDEPVTSGLPVGEHRTNIDRTLGSTAGDRIN